MARSENSTECNMGQSLYIPSPKFKVLSARIHIGYWQHINTFTGQTIQVP